MKAGQKKRPVSAKQNQNRQKPAMANTVTKEQELKADMETSAEEMTGKGLTDFDDTTKQIAESDEKTSKTKMNHRFIRNDQYFTICVYTFILVICCTLAIKAIISFDQTRAALSGLFRAISPFLIAILIAYILDPFVNYVRKVLRKQLKKVSDKGIMVLSMLLVYLFALGVIITILTYILPELVKNLIDLINQLPVMYGDMQAMMVNIQERFPNLDLSAITNMLNDVQGDLTQSLMKISTDVIPVLYTASVSVVQWLGNFLIALIVSVYMLYGKQSLHRIVRILFYAFVPEKQFMKTRKIINECNAIFGKYMLSKMLDSLIIGMICAVLMSILQLPYVLLISVIVGVTNMIPYFGPFIGAVPGVIIILSISPIKAVIFAIMILCLQQFDGLILGPKLLGDSTGMKPIWIIFAITIGGKFFGVIGMFLGVPVVATLGHLAELYLNTRLKKKKMSVETIR